MALCVLVCVAFPSAAAAPNLTRWATEGLPEYQYDGPLTEPRGVEQKQPRATHETETKHGGGCSVERMRRYNALAEKINGLLDLMRDHEPDPTGVNGGNSPCGTPSAPWEIKMSAPDAPSRYAAARDAYEYAAAMYNATRRPVPTSTSPHAANIRFLREFDNPKSPVEIETVYDQLLRGTHASGGLQNSITRPSQHNSTTPYQQQNEPLYHLTKHDGVAAAAPIPPEGTKERRASDSGRDSVSIPSESVSPRPSDTHAVPCDAVSTTPCVSSARAHRKMTIRWLQNQIAAKIHALTPASTSTDPSPNPNPDPNPDPNHGPASTNSDAVGSASESQSQTINLKNSNGCKECEMPSVKDIECASQKFQAMAAAVTAAQKLENLQRQLNDQVAKKVRYSPIYYSFLLFIFIIILLILLSKWC